MVMEGLKGGVVVVEEVVVGNGREEEWVVCR